MDETTFVALKRVIKDQLEIDIEAYKGPQMRRRLDHFVATHGGGSPARWVQALAQDAAALAGLRDMLTINVSEFFRDALQFELLRTRVLPSLLEARSQLSIWSAACSNGQEPYSLAILLDELEPRGRSRVLATDIDRGVLERARAGGPYAPADVRNVSPERLARYFTPAGGAYQVAASLRNRVTFREHNLLATPYGSNFDLIVCRNVLIYLSAEAKLEIVTRFHQALRPGGVLFIGGTEALLGTDGRGYRVIGGNFYQKTGEAPAKLGQRVA